MTKFEPINSPELAIVKDIFNELSYLQLEVNLAYIVESYIYSIEREYYYKEDKNSINLKREYKTKYGLKDGYYKEWHSFNWHTGQYDNQSLESECMYSNGYKIGKYVEWWNNGVKAKECVFSEDGKIEGEYKSWYRNGNKWIETVYSNNTIDGEYKEWDQYGELIRHFIKRNDKMTIF